MGQERITAYDSTEKSHRTFLSALPSTACFLLFIALFLLFSAAAGFAAEITSVNAKLINNELFAAASVKPDAKLMGDMNEGLSKEFIFYVDLFRAWKVWPDEFVTGVKLVRVLKSDPIKREYVASSLEGNLMIKKRFKDVESMISWAMSIPDLKLANVKEFDPGTYYVKVTVESNIRKLPPVIGHLLFFVTEKEFSISKNSAQFQVNMK